MSKKYALLNKNNFTIRLTKARVLEFLNEHNPITFIGDDGSIILIRYDNTCEVYSLSSKEFYMVFDTVDAILETDDTLLMYLYLGNMPICILGLDINTDIKH